MKVEFDASKFNAFITEMTRAIPASRREVIRAETGSILKAWVLRTKVAKARHLKFRGTKAAVRLGRRFVYGGSGKGSELKPGEAWFTMGRGSTPVGRVWLRNKNSPRSFFLLRGPGAPKQVLLTKKRGGRSSLLYRVTRGVMPAEKKAALGSAGISRQSIVQIGDALGIRIEAVPGGRNATAAVAKARRAIASDGRVYPNGVGSEVQGEHTFFTKLVNSTPWGRNPRIQMDVTLALVMKGRMNYFRRNVAAGVFGDIKKIAEAYPGIHVTAPQKVVA